MPKKKSVFTITENLNNLFIERPAQNRSNPERLTIVNALTSISRQMEISGNRPRTISDYSIHVNHFKDTTMIVYLEDITVESIYDWLSCMEVSNQTKLTRLKCLKAFLSRCFSNGWINTQFSKSITIRVLHKGDFSRAFQNKNFAILSFTLFIYIPLFLYIFLSLILTRH